MPAAPRATGIAELVGTAAAAAERDPLLPVPAPETGQHLLRIGAGIALAGGPSQAGLSQQHRQAYGGCPPLCEATRASPALALRWRCAPNGRSPEAPQADDDATAARLVHTPSPLEPQRTRFSRVAPQLVIRARRRQMLSSGSDPPRPLSQARAAGGSANAQRVHGLRLACTSKAKAHDCHMRCSPRRSLSGTTDVCHHSRCPT